MAGGFSVLNSGNPGENKNYAKGPMKNPSNKDYDQEIVKHLSPQKKHADPYVNKINASSGLLGHLLNRLLTGVPQGVDKQGIHAERTAGGLSIKPHM